MRKLKMSQESQKREREKRDIKNDQVTQSYKVTWK